MEPNAEQRLARIHEVTDGALRYYLTAYNRTDEAEEHSIKTRELLMGNARQAANVMALLEGEDLSDRAMLSERHEVVCRYQEVVAGHPWMPPS